VRRAFRLRRYALFLVSALACGCTSFGPVGVDPDRDFDGLGKLVAEVADGGTLDIFLVHGMRADAPQTYADVTCRLRERLALRPAVGRAADCSDANMATNERHPLGPVAPTVSIDGVQVFTPENWGAYRPHVTIERYLAEPGGKHVNFYKFEYWEALAYMKCMLVVAPDTRVVGDSSRSSYCEEHYGAHGGARLSSESDVANRWLKTEILEWGLADAVIVTSSYRKLLGQAVKEMLALARSEERLREGGAADVQAASVEEEIRRIGTSHRTRIAFITESLGSYVVWDALRQAQSSSKSAAQGKPSAETEAVRIEDSATTVVICSASQVHMFANQLALLRFSELEVSQLGGVAPSESARDQTNGMRGESQEAHFFRGCPPRDVPARSEDDFPARHVVAYHEPNDLLTYYVSDRPGYVGQMNEHTTNVVIPYTHQWVWFLAADPVTAHTGHPTVPMIMDMVACGRKRGAVPSCSH
jgi:hypothetical protein